MDVYNFINSMIEESKNCRDAMKENFNKDLAMTKRIMKILRTVLNVGFVIMLTLKVIIIMSRSSSCFWKIQRVCTSRLQYQGCIKFQKLCCIPQPQKLWFLSYYRKTSQIQFQSKSCTKWIRKINEL